LDFCLGLRGQGENGRERGGGELQFHEAS